MPIPARSEEEPILFVDPLNHFTIELPSGWTGSAPSADFDLGMSVITNYSEAEVIARGHRQYDLLADTHKIQFISRPVPGGDLDVWAAESEIRT